MRTFFAWFIEDGEPTSLATWSSAATVIFGIALLLWPTIVFSGSTEVRDRNGRLIERRTYQDGTGVVRDANGTLKETWTRQGSSIVVRDRHGRIVRIEKIK